MPGCDEIVIYRVRATELAAFRELDRTLAGELAALPGFLGHETGQDTLEPLRFVTRVRWADGASADSAHRAFWALGHAADFMRTVETVEHSGRFLLDMSGEGD